MHTHARNLGKYELQTILGSGGMGEVWKAFDTQLRRYVAIKLLQANLQNDPNFVMRFQREAQVIASLHHPNIVQLFDFHVMPSEHVENCTGYMVMDYVDGQTLAHFITATSRRGQFPPFRAIAHLFIPLSMAIDYAHQKGMLHRDIKPANVLLDSRLHSYSSPYRFIGEPILSDFGIAKLMGTSTNTLSGLWGTPHYTSPEQARGEQGDKRSDLYALGAILYEMFTGMRLFQGNNPAAIFLQHIQAMPTAPSLINPNISSAVSIVILKSVAKDPADRFQSAKEMTMALFQALRLPLPEDLSDDASELHSQMAQITHEQTLSSSGPSASSSNARPVSSNPFLLSSPVGLPVKSSDLSISTPAIHSDDVYGLLSTQALVEDESLDKRLIRLGRPLEEIEVLLYARQILDTLDYLGKKTPPILYGDIRPENIIVGARDQHAYLIAQGKNAASIVGYAPLEQLQGHPDPRSDLYSLAVTMHHLLTNRDPVNHPPFVYPLVRQFNPKVSPEVERILIRGLVNDMTQRYQNAAEMRKDISEHLLSRYAIADAASEGTFNTPGVKNSEAFAWFHRNARSQDVSGRITPIISSSHQKHTRRRSRLIMSLLLMLCVVVLALGIRVPFAPITGSKAVRLTNTGLNLPDGIGVAKTKSGEYVGISDGTFAFDTKRSDGQYKTLAAEKLKAKDFNSAYSLWQDALALQSNDAEAAIYLEDQRVLDSGNPYVTIVAGTTLTGSANNLAIGYECIQAAYIAQKEYNDASELPHGYKVRVLIANYGSDATVVVPVAQQVLRLVRTDKTIIGAMSWTFNAISVFSPAKIPMVSAFGADVATNISHYFFRITQPASMQGRISAVYAEQTLHAKTAVVFFDDKNNFSLGLATGFTSAFTAHGYRVLAQELYTTGKNQNMPMLLTDALSKKPDIIFFSGGPGDASPLLAHLKLSDPPVMGGSSLYQLGGYAPAARQGLNHLHFTTFSYPDEWDIEGLSAQKPAFFADYQTAFDPANQHLASPYGFRRADGTTMEQYDAIALMLYGVRIALTEQQQPTLGGLQHALTEVVGNRAYQGVTGQISLGPDGNPVDRAVVGICVTSDIHFKMDGIYGKFLKGKPLQTQFLSKSVCS